MATFEESYFTMVEIFSGLTKEEAMFAESFLINKIPTYTPYGYNKSKEEYNLIREKSISENNPDLYEKLFQVISDYKNEQLI